MILAVVAWASLSCAAAAAAPVVDTLEASPALASPLASPKPARPAVAGEAAKSGRSDTDYGGLPPTERWVLMLVGFGMIGGAIRGFVVANRALQKLQPDGED
jgi:hypothetical protein